MSEEFDHIPAGSFGQLHLRLDDIPLAERARLSRAAYFVRLHRARRRLTEAIAAAHLPAAPERSTP